VFQNTSEYYQFAAGGGGAGGGGGGGALVFSTTGKLTVNGPINVNGGNGGNGGAGGANANSSYPGGAGGGGGAGGAGGTIVLQATTVQVNGSLLAQGGNGGAAGSPGTGGSNGYPGAGGGGGRILIISPDDPVGAPADNHSDAQGSTGGRPTVQIVKTSACTPTITGIKFNGQSTNTIIAGTSGSVAILGSCLSGFNSVSVDQQGIQFTSPLLVSDTEIDASYQATASATWGPHNVTVTTVNGASGASSSAQVFAVSVTLQSFSFTHSVAYYRDCVGAASPISAPAWPAPSATCPQTGSAGDHAVYVSGDTMQGTAVFVVNPVPSQGVSGIYIEGTTGGAGTFRPTGTVSIQAGAGTLTVPLSDDTAFPTSRTQFINPLSINWNVAQTGSSCASGCVAAGTSSNPVYVTLANNVLPTFLPTNSTNPNPIMLTYVKLAVGNGGAYNQATALANTWAQFSTGNGPANVSTWDGRSMQYYTAGFNSCAYTAQQVVENLDGNGNYSPSAQCGAFALLLESALAVNGIHSNWTQINATYSDPTYGTPKMVIKNWCFIGTSGCAAGPPSYSNQSPWIYQMYLNVGDYMYPSPGFFGDLTNLQGVPGQGENGSMSPPFTPVEKVFDLHFIVQITTIDGLPLGGDQFFDPSYGVTYSSAAGFEAKAVAGYACQFPPDIQGSGSYHVFTPIAGSPDISFTLVPQYSM
jgi:hypothetical protein